MFNVVGGGARHIATSTAHCFCFETKVVATSIRHVTILFTSFDNNGDGFDAVFQL